jgi:hypothetical protein
MAGAQHRTPEYLRYYRTLKLAQRAGQWFTCVEPVCVMPTRDIAPWMPTHICHDPTGTVILGPGHRRCNITEVNERRGGKRAIKRKRGARVLKRLVL